MSKHQSMSNVIRIATLNVGGLFCNVPYVEQCLNNTDIFVIQEHWLYPDSISLHPDFNGWGRSSNELNLNSIWRRGKGGIAVLWRKSFNVNIQIMDDIGNDRIIAIQLKVDDKRNFYIIGTYLPSANQPIALYKESVDELDAVINELSNRGIYVILGDFNCHIGNFGGPRSYNAINDRGKYFIAFMEKFSLLSINSQNYCTGPIETYYSNNGKTTVDHVLISENYINLAQACYISDDDCGNLSFHRPIFCKIKACNVTNGLLKTKEKSKIAWKNMCDPVIRENYQRNVADAFVQLNINDLMLSDISSIENTLTDVTNLLQSCANRCIPKVNFKKHLKPYWKQGLKTIHDKSRYQRKIWISQGRPRDSQNTYYRAYKQAKCDFRRELRRRAHEYESQEYERLENIFEVDSSVFQRIMSGKRKSKGIQTNALKIDGKFISDPNELCEIWKQHYSKLYTPAQSTSFDLSFTEHVESSLYEYERESRNAGFDALDNVFSVEEVSSICSQLPNGKSSGPDGLTYEHIKYGGDAVMSGLTTILNAIRNIEIVPNALATGDIISLFKTNKKIRHNIDNYRGITLLNVVGKIFERLILDRWMPFLADKGFPNSLQFAYQKDKSCIDASMSLQEAVLHNIEHGSKVYCCFLDSTKAFDTVWISGLFYKLYNLGIQGKTWRLLRNWYSKLTSRVITGGIVSAEFPILQGVRQGGVLSPWLFMIYNDDLPKIFDPNDSLWLNKLRCSPIMVADDIALLSTRVQSLQQMLSSLERYSEKWRFEFNPTKTRVITFGESTQMWNKIKNTRRWTLFGTPVREERCWTHVGIDLCGSFSSTERTSRSCQKGMSVMASLVNVGARPNALNPICGGKLWLTIGIPAALYGCELWNNLTTNEILAIEKCQRFNAKRLQGLPKNTRSEAVTGSLGLWSMEGQIDKVKLVYFGRLCNINASLISKQIFVGRLFSYLSDPSKQRLGLIPDTIRILEKYNLISYLMAYKNELIFPSKREWKKLVHKEIMEYEMQKWKYGMRNKEELAVYQEIHRNLEPLNLWRLAKKHPNQKTSIMMLVNIMCGNVPPIFNSWTYIDGTRRCAFCQLQVTNVNFHFIMTCRNFNEWRNNLWDELMDKLQTEHLARIYSLDETDLYKTIISGETPGLNNYQTFDNEFCLIVVKHIRKLVISTDSCG